MLSRMRLPGRQPGSGLGDEGEGDQQQQKERREAPVENIGCKKKKDLFRSEWCLLEAEKKQNEPEKQGELQARKLHDKFLTRGKKVRTRKLKRRQTLQEQKRPLPWRENRESLKNKIQDGEEEGEMKEAFLSGHLDARHEDKHCQLHACEM